VGAKTLKLIGGIDMLGEGIFVLIVSLSGDYKDDEYIANFIDCTIAMEYFKENCSQHKAARCISEQYINLPDDRVTKDSFSFVITEPQSCGFIGVDTRKKFLKD